jgi:Tol biopolymer transport system component
MISEPVFSHDGTRLAYISKGRDLIVVNIAPDGSAVGRRPLVADFPMTRPRWGPGDLEISFASTAPGGPFIVYSNGSLGDPPRSARAPVHDTISRDGRLGARLSFDGRELSIEDVRTKRVTTIPLRDEYRPLEEGAFSPAGDQLLLIPKQPLVNVIRTLNLSDSREREGIKADVPIRAAAWSARGDAIYLLHTDSKLARVPLDPSTGRIAGEVKTIAPRPGNLEGMSLSRDGKRLVYTAVDRLHDLVLVTLAEPGSGETSKVEKITSDGAPKMGLTVSPDGRSVAFRRADRSSSICTAPLTERINPEWVTCFGGRPVGDLIAWSPDGRALAFASPSQEGTSIYEIGADAKNMQRLGGGEVEAALAWLPGNKIFYQSKNDTSLMLLEPGTGEERVLFPRARLIRTAIPSPDGKLLAIEQPPSTDPDGGGLFVFNVDDRSLRKLASKLRPAGWSPDGRHIYAYSGDDSAGEGAREIVAFPLEGGDSRRLGELPFESGALRKVLHVPGPDLRFVCEVAEISVDLWMVNEFEV